MTQFEQMLIDKGYIKHIFNGKTMKFEVAKGHNISTMVNLGHIYFHNTDTNVLNKIESGKSIIDNDFTFEDRIGAICFGLHEVGRPPTLINPRPRIEIKRMKEGKVFIENEQMDSSMHVVLQHIDQEQIFKAMYDHSIILKIDLTK